MTVEELRTELVATRQQHRDELTAVRDDAKAVRDEARADHLAQLAEIKQANTERIETMTGALTSAQQMIAQLRQERDAAAGEARYR